MRKVAVIGLGRFGVSVAKRLAASGVQVIAMDRNGQLVNEIKDDVDLAVRADSTDQQALLSQNIDNVDVAVVSIGENFEAALLTTVILKQLGVPEVVCRAQTEFHAEIFRKIGADRVIQPESESGQSLARQLANPQLVDFIRLADGFTLLEFHAPASFCGKSILSLALRSKYDVNLVVIRRAVEVQQSGQSRSIVKTVVPKPDDVIEPDDILVVVGSDTALSKLPRE
ncbi:MAG: TrkA family potassium uptake protein [Planctomycetaceae bacterium]|nr:TrkA family potassium uptake protein [Planctomycetaceae bacterium]MCA9029537.1 TrkA family potassium uptake protein [Planctomycetaceae bacterium]MCA9044397.1 TrkA family potassium uptake protein [Planctomycetaceae bacterium]MCB9950827.1 TrkA family potassium uptake protein [Planctomycetaceae bacterium]